MGGGGLQVHQIKPSRECSTCSPCVVTVPGVRQSPVYWRTDPPRDGKPLVRLKPLKKEEKIWTKVRPDQWFTKIVFPLNSIRTFPFEQNSKHFQRRHDSPRTEIPFVPKIQGNSISGTLEPRSQSLRVWSNVVWWFTVSYIRNVLQAYPEYR